MNILERLIFEPPGGMFREFFGVKAYLEPKDLSLYRQLLPEPFSMPDSPIVMIFVADYVKVIPWLMPRYQEGAILLRSVWKGEEGWYVAAMPVTKWLPLQGGRYLGFPKYIADEITLTKTGENWKAQVRYEGLLRLTLEFQPGLIGQLAPREKKYLEIETFFHDDFHLLVPPARGPHAQTVQLVHAIPAKSAPVLGMVCVKVERSEPWAGLMPDEIEVPGACSHFMGGINLVRKDQP